MAYNFTCATDEEHKINIASHFLYAVWKSSAARGGSDASFEVRTSFVGQGAEIEITCNGDDYGKIETIKDKIYNNKFLGKIRIPDTIKPGEGVWLDVKLSKQKLNGKSNSIPGTPKLLLIKMQWDREEAYRGDLVKLQAELEQVADNTEALVIIYEYDQDGNHDKITSLPTTINDRKINLMWEFDYHEDIDEIPTQEEVKQYGKKYNPPEYFFIVVIDGIRLGDNQESGILTFKDWLEIELKDNNKAPIPDQEYVVTLPDGEERKGKVSRDGTAIEKNIPPGKCLVNFPNLDDIENLGC